MKKTPQKPQRMVIYLPLGLRKKIKAAAQKNCISESAFVRQIILQHLSKE